MSNHPPHPSGPPRLPGSSSLGYGGAPSFPPLSAMSPTYPSHGSHGGHGSYQSHSSHPHPHHSQQPEHPSQQQQQQQHHHNHSSHSHHESHHQQHSQDHQDHQSRHTHLNHHSHQNHQNHENHRSQSSHYNSYASHSSEGYGTHYGPGNPGVTVNDLYHSAPVSTPPPPPPSLPPAHNNVQSLPSMRTIDVLHPPPSLHHHLPGPPTSLHHSGSGSGSGSNPPGGGGGGGLPPFYSMQPSYSMYAHTLPPFGLTGSASYLADLRMSAMGMGPILRHKKEIKRRTKTGCMTCRKRRIKCDETHPTCNNCKKSKRECAGYDPIFKQLPHYPNTLQSTTTPASGSSTGSAPTTTTTTAGNPTTSISPTSSSASSAVTAANASTTTSTAPGPGAGKQLPPSLSSPSTASSSSVPSIYSAAGHLPSPSTSSSSHFSTPSSGSNPYSSRSLVSPSHPPGPSFDLSGPVYRAKMKIDDIIGLNGPAPPAPATPPTHETLDALTKMYYDVYVPGLSSFFETTWYNLKPDGSNNPISILLNNKPLVGFLATFLDAAAKVQENDAGSPDMAAASAQELRVVWSLASMAYSAPTTVNLQSDEPVPVDDAIEARNRLSVVDTLLSGGCVRANPCMPPPRSGDAARLRELQFWWWLAEYLRLQDDTGLSSTPGNSPTRLREQALAQMRGLLDGRENRDLIYSFAVLRELAPRYPVGYLLNDAGGGSQPPHDESEPRSKLVVAAKFVRTEAQDNGGTTNVVRRFAQLGYKAFVEPGCNVRRL